MSYKSENIEFMSKTLNSISQNVNHVTCIRHYALKLEI